MRPKLQFDLFHLPGSVNIPVDELAGRLGEVAQLCALRRQAKHTVSRPEEEEEAAATTPLVVVCRRGNASQQAVQQLRNSGLTHAIDIIGGLTQWGAEVDEEMPVI